MGFLIGDFSPSKLSPFQLYKKHKNLTKSISNYPAFKITITATDIPISPTKFSCISQLVRPKSTYYQIYGFDFFGDEVLLYTSESLAFTGSQMSYVKWKPAVFGFSRDIVFNRLKVSVFNRGASVDFVGSEEFPIRKTKFSDRATLKLGDIKVQVYKFERLSI